MVRVFLKVLTCFVVVVAFSPTTFAKEGDAYFSVSPESAYSNLEAAIQGAQKSISLNIYMLTNKSITKALADKAAAGVKLTVLLEGETFGGEIFLPVKKTLDEFAADLAKRAPGNSKFLVMTGQSGKVARRFVFNHAKYLVIDSTKVFVSTENFTGSAFGSRNYNTGTRGWQILVENAVLARSVEAMFRADSAVKNKDVLPFAEAPFKVTDPGSGALPPQLPRDVVKFSVQQGVVQKAQACASPASLECIVGFIRSAKRTLDVEHLSLPLYWIDRKTGAKPFNPIVQEIVAAAKRGVKVRVLLNDDLSFGDEGGSNSDERNATTITWLRAQATEGRLPLEAGTFGSQGVQVKYVHTKGLVADGERVFVGSINGTENSVKNNRELALIVDGKDAGKFYGDVFEFDWLQRK